MKDLIEKLQKTEAGSSELDVAILRTLADHHFSAGPVPAYTTSLDAALALADRVVKRRGPIDLSICGSAQVMIHHQDPCGNMLASAFAATPALALCIAILKAKESSNG